MRIMEPESRPQALIRQLLTVWEGAVKQTHLFLSAEEIEKIKQYVPQALRVVPHLVVLENRDGVPVAFMGIEERNLEMLFVAPEQRGQGWGKSLIEYGVERYGIETVGVNEQNPQARGFYEHLGFVAVSYTHLSVRFYGTAGKRREQSAVRLVAGRNGLALE